MKKHEFVNQVFEAYENESGIAGVSLTHKKVCRFLVKKFGEVEGGWDEYILAAAAKIAEDREGVDLMAMIDEDLPEEKQDIEDAIEYCDYFVAEAFDLEDYEIYPSDDRFTLPGDDDVTEEAWLQDTDTYIRNTVYAQDGQPWIRGYGVSAVDDSISLVNMMQELCAAHAHTRAHCPLRQFEGAQNDAAGIKKVSGTMLSICDATGCPMARIYYSLVAAAENYTRLRYLEDKAEGREVHLNDDDLCPMCSMFPSDND